MNKFKSIFCAVMLFMVCTVMCVGCSFNFAGEDDAGDDEKTTQITISLTEAESAILGALQNKAGQINKDPFQKWGNFEFASVLRDFNPDTNELIASQKTSLFATCENGVYDRVYETYELNDLLYDEHSIREHYTVGDIQYTYKDSSVVADNLDEVGLPTEADVVKKLFADDFLYLVFGNKVTKEVTTNGYTLVFKNGFQGLVNYLCIMRNKDVEEYAEFYLKQFEAMYSEAHLAVAYAEAYVKLLVEFDKQNNITEIIFSYVAFEPSMYVKSKAVIVAKKSTANISAPEWYLDYIGVDAK